MDPSRNILGIETNWDEYRNFDTDLFAELEAKGVNVVSRYRIEDALDDASVIPFNAVVICTHPTDEPGTIKRTIEALRPKVGMALFIIYGPIPAGEEKDHAVIAVLPDKRDIKLLATIIRGVLNIPPQQGDDNEPTEPPAGQEDDPAHRR